MLPNTDVCRDDYVLGTRFRKQVFLSAPRMDCTAQRTASVAPLATSINRHGRRHATTGKNCAQPMGRASGVNCTQCWAAVVHWHANNGVAARCSRLPVKGKAQCSTRRYSSAVGPSRFSDTLKSTSEPIVISEGLSPRYINKL